MLQMLAFKIKACTYCIFILITMFIAHWCIIGTSLSAFLFIMIVLLSYLHKIFSGAFKHE